MKRILSACLISALCCSSNLFAQAIAPQPTQNGVVFECELELIQSNGKWDPEGAAVLGVWRSGDLIGEYIDVRVKSNQPDGTILQVAVTLGRSQEFVVGTIWIFNGEGSFYLSDIYTSDSRLIHIPIMDITSVSAFNDDIMLHGVFYPAEE